MSTATAKSWIAARAQAFDSSGIRKLFDLAATKKDLVNLSIGQPDFDVPQVAKDACIEAIQNGNNAYAPTQGIVPLRERLQSVIDARFQQANRKVFVSSGTSGGLVLAMMTLIDPGDEVILFDPYFVMYPSLVQLVGGVPVLVDTYPHFRIDLARLEQAITEKTKMIVFNSPNNPTGLTSTRETVEEIAQLAAQRGIALISDEIYSTFQYGVSQVSAAEFNEDTIVIDGFSKSHAMTGWRLGYVHGPSEVIQNMVKLQQYTFVCAPQPVQWAGLAALDIDMSLHVQDYSRKRDMIVDGLKNYYDFQVPEGAFYLFPKVPSGTASEFVKKAIENHLLVVPGHIFSRNDSHFRISFAAPDPVLERGIDILKKLAKG